MTAPAIAQDAPPQPAGPLCTCCGKPRKRRKDDRGWAGGQGWCTTCHGWWCKNGKPEGGPVHPSLRPKPGSHRDSGPRSRMGRPPGSSTKWYDHPDPAPAPSERAPLKSGWEGYRPSTGTAGASVAA